MCGYRRSFSNRFQLVVSDQFKAELAANRQSGALQRLQCNGDIGRIQQTV